MACVIALLLALLAAPLTAAAEPTKPRLMVVFASRENKTETPRTLLLFEDAAVDRKSDDLPEEPSKELLPPHVDREDVVPRGHSHLGDLWRLQDDPKDPKPGYGYPKPQQDDPEPAPGYSYPKPQQDDPKPAPGYSYPKPQQDDPKPAPGYSYPKPQQDDPKPAPGYSYPKPQQDDPKPAPGYDYLGPQHDTGYTYPRPDLSGSTWRPVLGSADQDYLPPKEQLPLDDPSRPTYSDSTPTVSITTPPDGLYLPVTEDKRPTLLLEELPDSYGPPRDRYLPPTRPALPDPPLREDIKVGPPNGYLPPTQNLYGTFGPPKQPLDGATSPDSYLPPEKPLADDVHWAGLAGLRPQKEPPRDHPHGLPTQSHVNPPREVTTQQPVRHDAPSDTYLPPEPPLRDDQDPVGGSPQGSQSTARTDFPPLEQDGVKASAQPRHLSTDEHGIRVTDMSCLRTATRARFTATISSPTFVAWPPVLEAVPGGGAAPPGCRVIADPADPHHRFLVDLSNPDLARCGVKGCSVNGEARLCSRILVPSLPGLRLAADPVLLLQCTLQPATGSVLQHASIAAAAAQPATGPAGRWAVHAVHAGGERAPLHAQLLLFRRERERASSSLAGLASSTAEFSRQMQSGGAVLLGDELQLRAVIRRGDGWQSSRLADVVVRRGSDAVRLVDGDGCPNPDMRAVCPKAQAWLAGDPLVSLLPIKVFMFRGMDDGDQLVLSARVVACLDRADCSAESCRSAGHILRVRRSSRSSRSSNYVGLNVTTTYEASVAFTVQVRGARQYHVVDVSDGSRGPVGFVRFVALMAVLAVVLLSGASLLLLLSSWRRRRGGGVDVS